MTTENLTIDTGTAIAIPEVTELETTVRESNLDPADAVSLLQCYRPIFEEVHGLMQRVADAQPVTDATQLTEMRECRALRLALGAERVRADKLRKRLKEDGLRRGNAVQGVFNLLKYMIEPV